MVSSLDSHILHKCHPRRRSHWFRTLVLGAFACLLASCSSTEILDFKETSPRFLMEEFFLGKTVGQGMFYDRFGNLAVTFSVELNGTWDGKNLTLDEVLSYDTGETLQRTYQIEKIDEHHYIAHTADVDGVVDIAAYGNALEWRYRLRQKIGDSVWTLSFDDWMFLRDDGTVLNRAVASKWGFEVGQVFMAIRKVPS